MTARPVPARHWRSYGNDPLPAPQEAMNEPFRAFPSWLLRIECDACGKVRVISETHFAHGYLPIRTILRRARHEGCGGRVAKAELLTGLEAATSRPVRRIVLMT